MALHSESEAKAGIRSLLLRAAESLGRGDLRFLGLPAEKALDVKALKNCVSSATCIANDQQTLDECARSLALIPLRQVTYHRGDAWQYLRDVYSADVLADVAYLDFYGGGIRKQPFLKEVPALENFFLRHAMRQNRACVFAWTYMPRDDGEAAYDQAIRDYRVDKRHRDIVGKLKGLPKRSFIIRIILAKLLARHGFSAALYHHAVYKNTMNALILVFSKGADALCRIPLTPVTDEMMVEAPYFLYSDKGIQEKFLVL